LKLSVETRHRIRALGGDTFEDASVAALDALEVIPFWAQVDAAVRWKASLSDEQRRLLADEEAAIDAAFDGLE
jgi:hypothetical protein